MKRALLLLVLACHRGHAPAPTPTGTSVATWKIADSRTEIRSATLDQRAVKDVDIADDRLGVKLRLHVELATASFTEAGVSLHVPTVTALTATVVDSNGYILDRGSCDGPYYEAAQAPTTTILGCSLQAHRGQDRGLVVFEVDGTAVVLVSGNSQQIIQPK